MYDIRLLIGKRKDLKYLCKTIYNKYIIFENIEINKDGAESVHGDIIAIVNNRTEAERILRNDMSKPRTVVYIGDCYSYPVLDTETLKLIDDVTVFIPTQMEINWDSFNL